MKSRFFWFSKKALVVCSLCGLVSVPVFAQAGWGTVDTKAPSAKKEKEEVKPQPTPRLADGHPDLNGIWGTLYGDNYPADKVGNVTYIGFGKRPDETRGNPLDVNDQDAVDLLLSRKDGLDGGNVHDTRIADYKAHPNHMPPYKPELLDKVAYSDLHAIQLDPDFFCGQPGVPRIGAPDQIVETPGLVVFLYSRGGKHAFRIIPTDGRPHRTDLDPMFYGDSVGHWEGDTLVVDVNNLDPDTWLGNDGWFHSDALHVIERFTREGNALTYQVTVDDPKDFIHPWVREPHKIELTTNPEEVLYEAPPCKEEESSHMTTLEHH